MNYFFDFIYTTYVNTIVIPLSSIVSIKKNIYTGLFEVTVVEPIPQHDTIDKLLFNSFEPIYIGDKGKQGVKS